MEAFRLIQEVEKAGGDVDGLVSSLNRAVELVGEGELTSDSDRAEQLFVEAGKIVNDVTASAPKVKNEGLLAQRNRMIWLTVELSGLGIIGLFIYRYGPQLFWKIWLRSHREWRVRFH